MDFDALHGTRATGGGNARKQAIAQSKDQRDLEVLDEVAQEEADSASSLPVREDDFPTDRACSLESYSIPKQDERPSFSRQDDRETARLDTPIGELERKNSGMCVIYGGAGSGAESDAGEEGKRFQPGKPNPASQFKGVVPQPNGRWGAQIYEKHQRVWLGTFNKQQEAARAYDRAALKFRGRDTMTNFTAVEDADTETVFLEAHTKEQVVDMLRRHTYEEELEQSKKMASKQARGEIWEEPAVEDDVREGGSGVAMMREHMFDKVLTPSDVGKLNRLVIPKQHAERCFPLDPSLNEKGLLLNFEDPTNKLWRFRFSYWNSSQSYVLTKGWSRFVKEKQLDAGDVVSFERGVDRKLFFISSKKRAPEQLLLTQKEHQLTMAAAAAAAARTSHVASGPFGSLPVSWFQAFGDVLPPGEKLTQTDGFNPKAELRGSGLSGSGFPWRSGGMGTPMPSMAVELSYGSNPSFVSSDRSSTIEAQDLASHIHQSRNEDFGRLQKLNLSVSHPEVDTTLELGREESSTSLSHMDATGDSSKQGFRLFGVDLKPAASQSPSVGNIFSEHAEEEAQDFLANMCPATECHFKRARSEERLSLRKAIAQRDFLGAGKRKSSEIPHESFEESASKSFKSPSI